ncbi:DUF2194 domain-containing protein [Aliifodinibius sp. S!AR15-10]|uniref:DUF2194 domain-containing protein n=1 Tax=Aliifodinibius sp. S!AR15-10 TaxID=2950437 RepID=UPI00285B7AB9|nr:DUF2194 domain-containing protein [Aliifodinibius sp. S!AR15-10]MDR8391014.1 DUF2194 domain-containing protein [Aliifodinibius sp. S!AR15-10]
MNRISYLLFLALAIGSLMNGCTGGCSNKSGLGYETVPDLPESEPMVMVLKNRQDSTSSQTAYQLTRSFDYTKIPYTTHDLSLLSQQKLVIPESVRLICLTTSEVEQMSDSNVEKLVQFVAEGNSLFTTTPVWDARFGYLLGIKPQSDYKQELHADGFEFHQLAFPGFRDGTFKQPEPFYHRGFHKSVFHDSVEVLASSHDSLDTPVIIENEIGDGTSAFFNSQIGYEKSYRGILFSVVLKLLEGVAYPVANTSTIFLDDFPAPLYSEKMPPIDWEYDMTHAEFVTKVWWPDMQKLADKYHIDYSAMIAFNYNANVVPPFDFKEWTMSKINIPGEEDRSSIGMAQDIAASRHELAIHGYNHFSLWLEDWPNQEFMISAMQAARKRWRIDNLGPLPVTYVPPTNLIDSTGIQALSRAIPQVKTMSSLYVGYKENGTGREFSTDPYDPSLFDYPRITSGFVADDNSMAKQQGMYLLTGIWTHFVHPDDVYQVVQSKEDIFASRNERGLGWHRNRELDYGLYEVFERRIQETIRYYPFIRFKSAKDAVPFVKDWTETQAYRSDRGDDRQIVYNLNAVQQQRGVTYNPSYWFMYVKEQNREQVELALSSQTKQLTFVPIWNGYLAQFSTRRDTLNIPNLHRQRMERKAIDKDRVARVLNSYQDYQQRVEGAEEEDNWTDTRLQDALANLKRNPKSEELQNRVIVLAIEFDRINLAISLLEKRLLTSDLWNTGDIKRLITYYGWTGKSGQAWALLEKLWQRHQDQSVIALKDMMVSEFGSQGQEFRTKWLRREHEIAPKNEAVLTQLVRSTDGEQTWPQMKKYLKDLISLNPKSDTLYKYSLQRSLWYDSPDSTIQMLHAFPSSARGQLQPLSDQIANLYAYSAGNYDQALVWADRSNSVTTQTRLQWLQQASREEEFRERAQQEVTEEPANDSLRAYVGKEFIYNGRSTLGYEILYPLFKENRVPQDVEELIHTEIGYQDYERKKELYKRYPAFFTDKMVGDLQHQFRTTEGFAGEMEASYSSDNFNNNLAGIGLTSQWGYRPNHVHTITVGRSMVESDFNTNLVSDQLTSLDYTYQQSYRQQSMQSTLGGGFRLTQDGTLLPNLRAGLWKAVDSTFTSGELNFSPVMTNTAISQGVKQVKGSLYREDYWLKQGRLLTTFSGSGSWYTDEVFSFEALGRFYVQLPFSTSVFRTRVIGEGAYLDATRNYSSGIPYWTPNSLVIKGVGVDLRYQDRVQDPNFWVEAEVIGKHNRDGLYLAYAARLNARIARYWQLRLNAEISSSEIYRSNNIGFTLRYLLPKQLNVNR